MSELASLTLLEAAAGVRERRVTSASLTRAALERAQAAQARLNCFIRIDAESALEQAERADRAVLEGRPLGALHGVPLAHKDMFYEPGRITDCGSRVRQGFRPERESTLLARLRAAGAVSLGTLNMNEFALGVTGHNAVWGDCRNPWNPEHVPGGSSSGSGAAVAARVVYGSLGSDTGGSVRVPAAACGVVGLKPTYSRLSRYGCMGLSPSIDTPGPLARTVGDCARLLGAVAGHDPKDPTSSARPVPDYEAATCQDVRGARIGVPRNYFYDCASEEVRAAMAASLAVLEGEGAELVELEVPAPEHLSELSRAIVYSEATALHGQWLRHRGEEYSPQVRVRASTGLGIPASIYLEAQHLRPILLRRFVGAVFDRCDVLHTPTLSIAPPTLRETDVGSGAALWELLALLVHCTAPFNYLGLPALAVPAGFTRSGLPLSLQLAGGPFAEAVLLRVGAAYERATAWSTQAPPDPCSSVP